ncbi:MAG: hypothetical protein IPN68_05285 [Bacteroidetes bacterium]|nr:hypothetical protein [Bacteroidota bacterium]
MRKFLLINLSILLLSLLPHILINAQVAAVETSGNSRNYRIDDAFYIQDDSSTVLKNWTEQEMNIIFKPVKDSLIISIHIGGSDKVFFMGMAVKTDNPGFVTASLDVEFFHWMFVSRIKEGIRNAYIMKEYVDGSLEKLGKRTYFINIAFADQTEFQFYGYELNLKKQGPK